jgi:hypothetical protein
MAASHNNSRAAGAGLVASLLQLVSRLGPEADTTVPAGVQSYHSRLGGLVEPCGARGMPVGGQRGQGRRRESRAGAA